MQYFYPSTQTQFSSNYKMFDSSCKERDKSPSNGKKQNNFRCYNIWRIQQEFGSVLFSVWHAYSQFWSMAKATLSGWLCLLVIPSMSREYNTLSEYVNVRHSCTQHSFSIAISNSGEKKKSCFFSTPLLAYRYHCAVDPIAIKFLTSIIPWQTAHLAFTYRLPWVTKSWVTVQIHLSVWFSFFLGNVLHKGQFWYVTLVRQLSSVMSHYIWGLWGLYFLIITTSANYFAVIVAHDQRYTCSIETRIMRWN